MRRLVIGDIHGCDDELRALLDKAALDPSDEIIAIGDVVDRGPSSPAVLAFFQTHTYARSIQGNHERKHIRSFRGEIPPALSQRITREQLGADYPAAVAFMATFPLYLELPEALLVHGFWEPGVPLTAQRETVIAGTLSGEKYLTERYGRPWYELYDGAKPLIVGHHDYLHNGQPLVYRERVFGIDTGCCYGGALTALVLPDFRVVSVPSRANYWQVSRGAGLYGWGKAETPDEWDSAAEERLRRFYYELHRASERILGELRVDPTFSDLSAHEQDKRYAEQIGPSPLAPYLHRARHGKLTLETLRHQVATLERLDDLLARLARVIEGSHQGT